MKIRDRIKELRRVRAGDLIPSKDNWRRHGTKQKKVMAAVLKEIGYADALLSREDEDGRLILIDGHMRAEMDPDVIVPVLVLDVDELEADKILATLDPISAMAQSDDQALQALMEKIGENSDETSFQDLMSRIHNEETSTSSDSGQAPELKDRFAIMIECETEEDQLKMLKRFLKQGITCRAIVI